MIDKILEKLEDYKYSHLVEHDSESIEHCKEQEGHCEGSDCFLCIWDRAIEIVKEIAKEYGNGWIPCSERLPKKNINVLVCDEYGYIDICILTNGLSWMDENGDLWLHSSYIAWQPLPAPFKKGE